MSALPEGLPADAALADRSGPDGGDGPGPGDHLVGLDIGGTKVHGVLLDADGAVRGSARATTVRGADGVVEAAAAVVEELATGLAPGTALAGVGVGVPGLVDPLTATVSHAVNLGIDGDLALGALLSERLGGLRVEVENDLNAAALGAAHVLGLRSDLAFLALGTGVAAGVLLDGRVRRGFAGGAGEVGHLPYVADGPVCSCGQRGCLELYASGAALDAAWTPRHGRPAPAEVFEAAADGDPLAVELRDRFADAVAAAVRVLVLTYDVEHVLLGGGVAEIGDPLRDAVREALGRQAASSAFLRRLDMAERVRVVPPGTAVAPIGAALAVRGAQEDGGGAGLSRPDWEEVATWRS